MDYFTFNFKNYVQQYYKFDAEKWPPSIELAQLHSLCSKPGIPLENGPQCPCCHQKMKTPYSHWFKKNVNEDFTGLSSGICGFFLILKSFVLVTFVLMCLGSVYQLIMLYRFCASKDAQNCYKLFFLEFVDFGTMTASLQNSQIFGVLALAMYYFLLLANIFILYYLLQIKKNTSGLFTHNTLLVSGLVKDQFDKTCTKYGLDRNSYQYIQLTSIYDQFRARSECKKIFFEIMTRKLFGYDGGDIEKYNKKLIKQMDKKLKGYKQNHNFIVTFIHESQARKFNQYANKNKILCEYLKYPKDIRWQYSGQELTFDQNFITVLILIIVILVMMLLVFCPLIFDLSLDSQNYSSLTLAQILQCYLISFAISFASIVYTWIVARKSRKLKTNSSLAERIMLHNTLFSLMIYIAAPLTFTLLSMVNPGVGNYVVVQQATIVLVTQMIYSIIDPRYYFWKATKSLLMGNAKQSFKYNQFYLHKQVACVRYPLLNKLLVSMRIFSFAFGFCFVSPYMPLLLFLCSIIIYLSQKRNIYLHYRQQQLDISVILFSFMYTSMLTELLMCLFFSLYLVYDYQFQPWVAGMTVVPLVPVWIVKMWMYRNRYGRREQGEQGGEDKTLEIPIRDTPKTDIEGEEKVVGHINEEVGGYLTEYDRFLKRMRHAELFAKIEQYRDHLRK